LSDDGQVVLALCSALGLRESGGSDAAPFTLSEWNDLEKRIAESSYRQPAELQGCGAGEIEKELGVTPAEAERIARLLGRAGRLAVDLESFFSRGMWALTRRDQGYPARLRDTLKHQAPSVLFGAGEMRLLQTPGVAVVGSRNIDEAGTVFAKRVGAKTVAAGLPVVSGGARGTDRIAMDGAMEADGTAIGALADSLEATVRKEDVRDLLLDERLVLLTPYAPTAGFTVGGAMGRNKLIYGLAEFGVVVSSDFQTGGTWSGAVEALKAGWCPVFVRVGENVPKGNRELLKLGAAELKENQLEKIEHLADWMRAQAQQKTVETDLFGVAQEETGTKRRRRKN
jgi:predicted Rossmann fold nucleotide-binding protein DprA/Smf involved in DNA uptake